MTSLWYRSLLRLGIALAPLAARNRPKIRAGLTARRGLLARYRRFGADRRDPSRPLLWIHAASVGEARQAEAVLALLRPAHPVWQIAWTWFSPSASGLGLDGLTDFADVLPWDRPSDVDGALKALRPNALVFTKLDLWPELAGRASRDGTAVGCIAATVSPFSRRLRWPARALLAPGYRAVRRAGAIAPADAERLAALGVPRTRIEVTGDPRFDSAMTRASLVRIEDPARRYAAHGPTLVAGSTGPEDETRLFAAYRQVRTVCSAARLIVVPHEPTPGHLAGLDRRAAAGGLPNPERFSAGPDPAVPFLVVDQFGILPVLYADAAIAYVGGGFGPHGLHSVLEPAAAGVPTLIGPQWQGSPDAPGLLEAGGAASIGQSFPAWIGRVDRVSTGNRDALAFLWLALLRRPEAARDAGARACGFVRSGLGAAARSAILVERLMEEGRFRGT